MPRKPDRSRRTVLPALAAVLAAVLAAMALLPAGALAWDPEKTPATPVPAERYPNGGLRPVALLGDTTYYDTVNFEPTDEPFYFDVDIEQDTSGNAYLFAATGRGLEVWNVTDPSKPLLNSFSYGPTEFPFWGFSDTNFFIKGLDAPPGQVDTVAMAAVDLGLVIWNTSNKSNPSVHYQDQGAIEVEQVWAMRTSTGNNYALAADKGGQGGLKVYDMDRATVYNDCLENSTVSTLCTLVYRGRIGGQKRVSHVSGVSVGAKRYAAIRWQVGAVSNVEIWDVSNPITTLLPGRLPKLADTFPSGGFTHNLALWEVAGNYYLAGLKDSTLQIFDVNCIKNATGTCTLGAPVATVSVPNEPGTKQFQLSTMKIGGTPHIYVGNHSPGSLCLPQREYLLDVGNPLSPNDVAPDTVIDPSHPDGPDLGYWGWYYEPCTTGANDVMPRRAAAHPDPSKKIVYRAAYSILDSHELTGPGTPQPPTAGFSFGPTPIFEGANVDFTDQSTGSPAADQWSWTFEDGTPATSTTQSPTGVTFTLDDPNADSELKTVSLVSTNSAGSSPTEQQEVTVLNPRPKVAGVSTNVSNAFECSQVTFTADGVTGSPTPTLAWQVDTVPPNGAVATGGNVNPFVWSIDPGTLGQFTATATATSASGSDQKTSGTVQVDPLPPLAFTGAGSAPTVVSNSGGAVQFSIAAEGDTEWNWSFGDGTSSGWISDPVGGPSPTHVYSSSDTYTVTVQIRNCNEGPITSNAVDVTVEIQPLAISSFSASCLSFCFLTTGESFVPTHKVQGTPDTYEYDWDGNGTFEDVRSAPATSHTFCTSSTPTPALRIRRGNEPPVSKANAKLFSVTGSAACTAPSAPSGLTVTPSGGALHLVWSDNSVGETEYRVLRSTNGADFNALATLPAEAEAYVDNSVSENVIYTYKVQAFASPGGAFSGASGFTNTASGVITDPPLFADGFENGNTSVWSETQPPSP